MEEKLRKGINFSRADVVGYVDTGADIELMDPKAAARLGLMKNFSAGRPASKEIEGSDKTNG